MEETGDLSKVRLYYTFNDGTDKWSKYQFIPNESDFTELKETVDDLEKRLDSIAFNKCYPVGCTYIQLPGHKDPKSLLGLGTWQDISIRYQGAFFRVFQQGVSGAFSDAKNDGLYPNLQEASLPNITGGFFAQQIGGSTPAYGAFYHRDGSGKVDSGWSSGSHYRNYIGFDAASGDTTPNGKTYQNGAEVKPKNYAIRIWERMS